MENYTRIIESLTVGFSKASMVQFRQPLGIDSFYELYNTLIYVHQGELYYGKEDQIVRPGEVLFIPSGKRTRLNFGSSTPKQIIHGGLQGDQKDLIEQNQVKQGSTGENIFSLVFTSADVFNAVNLFASLDIPPFIIQSNTRIQNTISIVINEAENEELGRSAVLNCLVKELVTYVMRYILNNQLFVQQIITNINNLRDERLISLLKYINDNLPNDLSNKQLSQVVNVSEDYVGQYFKTLTGINPQDYIEFQRMQRAVALLRGSNKSISVIGKEIGYKDSSYFCRRFKMMFGISAGRMRRREKTQQGDAVRTPSLKEA